MILEFTGTLNPDPTGDFVEMGVYGGEPYYFNSVKGYYLFYNLYTGEWVVDDVLGSMGEYHWKSEDKISVGFAPGGEAAGTGNMHIKVTTSPIIELIAVNIEATINQITIANGFHQDLVALRCKRNDFASIAPQNGLVLIVQETEEVPAEQWTGTETFRQPFTLEAIVIDSDAVVTSIDTRINQVRADIHKKLTEDHTRGGYAIDTSIGPSPFFDNGKWTGVDVLATVEYRTKWGDPFTQG